jgi:hypothetical protein
MKWNVGVWPNTDAAKHINKMVSVLKEKDFLDAIKNFLLNVESSRNIKNNPVSCNFCTFTDLVKGDKMKEKWNEGCNGISVLRKIKEEFV